MSSAAKIGNGKFVKVDYYVSNNRPKYVDYFTHHYWWAVAEENGEEE
jgi:hypothetical protein